MSTDIQAFERVISLPMRIETAQVRSALYARRWLITYEGLNTGFWRTVLSKRAVITYL